MQEAPRSLRGFISASPSPVFNFLSSFPQFHILQYWQKEMHSFGFHGNSNNSFLLMSQFLLLSCACGITVTLGQRPPFSALFWLKEIHSKVICCPDDLQYQILTSTSFVCDSEVGLSHTCASPRQVSSLNL